MELRYSFFWHFSCAEVDTEPLVSKIIGDERTYRLVHISNFIELLGDIFPVRLSVCRDIRNAHGAGKIDAISFS